GTSYLTEQITFINGGSGIGFSAGPLGLSSGGTDSETHTEQIVIKLNIIGQYSKKEEAKQEEKKQGEKKQPIPVFNAVRFHKDQARIADEDITRLGSWVHSLPEETKNGIASGKME